MTYRFKFKFLNYVFSLIAETQEEGKKKVSEAKEALVRCFRLAVAEELSIKKSRSEDEYIDHILNELEASGDYNPSFEYILLRNVRAVCDAMDLEYLGEIGEDNL